MTADTDNRDNMITVSLPERVDSSTVEPIQRQMMDVLRPGLRMIVDGARVSYMSAAGVRMLATVLHAAQTKQARLAFCRFTGAAADCLLVSGFARLLEVVDSVEEATGLLSPKLAAIRAERLHPRHTTG